MFVWPGKKGGEGGGEREERERGMIPENRSQAPYFWSKAFLIPRANQINRINHEKIFTSIIFHVQKKQDCKVLEAFISLLQRRRWHPTPVLLPGKSRGRRSPVGCSPWGRSESDRTERLHFHFSLSCIGAGNGNPLQCSCLENPRDREPGGLPSMGSHRVGHDWSDLAAVAAALPSSKRIYAPNEPNRTRDYQLFT